VITIVGQAPSRRLNERALDCPGSGDRLAALCGIPRAEMLARCRAVNLLARWPGKSGKGDGFDMRAARRAASKMRMRGVVLLLGWNVARATGSQSRTYLEWHRLRGALAVVFPHPSGVNRWYNDRANKRRAARFLRRLLKETA
jgi:hypothetical protein